MTCGIYALKFTGTTEVYIGMSENIENRWNSHRHNLTNGTCSEKLVEAFKKYGVPTLEILCECTVAELDLLEREAIQIYDSIAKGFNSRDGGATGAGISVSGQGNGRAKYTNQQIEHAFQLLCNTTMTHGQIADKAGVSLQAVSHISCGTGHKWLALKYPVEHSKLLASKRSGHKEFGVVHIIDTTTSTEYETRSYQDIQTLTGCAYTSAVSLVSGQLAHLFNKWKLKVPVKHSNIPKKNKYFLKNTSTGLTVEVYSKLKFFTKYELTNRKKFSDFLKTAALGSAYQGWELVSVS